MPFAVIRNDITLMHADAIVNTANPRPVIGSGIDTAIHAAAGPELLEARKKIGRIKTGTSAITPAFDLDARYVIHTVGPVWRGGLFGEAKLLRSCYDSALKLAAEQGCHSIAIPLISTGNYRFPKDKALQIAIAAFSEFLLEQEMEIYLVIWGEETLHLSEKLFHQVSSYIDENYIQAAEHMEYDDVPLCLDLAENRTQDWDHNIFERDWDAVTRNVFKDIPPCPSELTPCSDSSEISAPHGSTSTDDPFLNLESCVFEPIVFDDAYADSAPYGSEPVFYGDAYADSAPCGSEPVFYGDAYADSAPCDFEPVFYGDVYADSASCDSESIPTSFAPLSLTEMLKQEDAGFSETLLKYIDKSGQKDSVVYQKAHLSKQHFSKIRKNPDYKPTKTTALSLALALELNLEQTKDLIGRAGYALTNSSKFDLIIRYCIEHKIYNLIEVNLVLYQFDQSLFYI